MTTEFKLAPSILSADFSDLGSALKICDEGGAHWIHVDVMDNQFVPILTIGPPVVRSLRPRTKKFIDVHMMVVHPEELVEPFARAGADNITFHIEATDDPDEIIKLIRSCGCKVGFSRKRRKRMLRLWNSRWTVRTEASQRATRHKVFSVTS